VLIDSKGKNESDNGEEETPVECNVYLTLYVAESLSLYSIKLIELELDLNPVRHISK